MKDAIQEQFEIEVWKLIEHALKRGCSPLDLLRILCLTITDLVQRDEVLHGD